MSEVLERATAQDAKLRIIDSDVHPSLRSEADLHPFLSERWRRHIAEYGKLGRAPYASRIAYPRLAPNTARRDAWPPGGAPPGSDLDFMRSQLLDLFDIEVGILEPLMPSNLVRNIELSVALCSAINDWQVAAFTSQEKRLRASILVPFEDPQASVAEIEKRVKDPAFAQIQLTSRSTEPIGRQRYWPIFEAAAHYGLPIGMHIGGEAGHAPTAAGWPSYYIEDHHGLIHSMQCQATSMVLEGVFERFPTLKVIMIEGGFAWLPSLAWRLDAHWRKLRSEVPMLKEPPSAYMKRNLWVSTQPMEEPENPEDLRRILSWIGWDRILYASDYPHWDFDDPRYAFPCRLSDAERRAIFRGNAEAVYRLA
ncbi:amidohydrolase family protein [Paracraurococcus lichenis]|uniref:Amidohydrolase family protein n=1 Tax=Paracraurococcus lichenis TaxID=3064888 RepID=A0ABT9E1U5_9PROT|nr:amidohydrolase family protein [Paracraurococcus sp. LOR1-02]MDO9710141.1 amidohydrolase family protein [Paracraurococcus sp. LOR1-02]